MAPLSIPHSSYNITQNSQQVCVITLSLRLWMLYKHCNEWGSSPLLPLFIYKATMNDIATPFLGLSINGITFRVVHGHFSPSHWTLSWWSVIIHDRKSDYLERLVISWKCNSLSINIAPLGHIKPACMQERKWISVWPRGAFLLTLWQFTASWENKRTWVMNYKACLLFLLNPQIILSNLVWAGPDDLNAKGNLAFPQSEFSKSISEFKE